MTSVFALSDVDPQALSVVRKAANGKTFFLRKAQADDHESMPSPHKLLKMADWSVVYCVVAEPGHQEQRGMILKDGELVPDPTDAVDVWTDEDEIRKAAHRFIKNGGLLTELHASLEPYGTLVENAVALSDITIEGETIRKGSWYIAFEPTDKGKQAIESDEFQGVSLEGSGIRTEIQKAFGEQGGHKLKCPKCGTVQPASNKTCVKCGHNLADARKAKFAQMRKAFGEVLDFFTGASLLDSEDAIAEQSGTLEATETEDFDVDEKRFTDLESKVDGLADTLGPLAERLTKALDKQEEDKAPTVEDLKKSLDEVVGKVTELADGVDKLAAGDSTQPERSDFSKAATDDEVYATGLLG